MTSSLMRWVRGAAVAMAAGLTACSSMGDYSPASLLARPRDPAAEAAALKEFELVPVCPQVQVRDGTQLLRIFERGKQDDPSGIRFQATITKFARECHNDSANNRVTIKVGVAGRLLTGPNGATGGVKLPLRVVLVKNGDEVVYSQIQPVDAAIAPGEGGMTWTKVVDGIVVPNPDPSARYAIYVGFDEGTPKS